MSVQSQLIGVEVRIYGNRSLIASAIERNVYGSRYGSTYYIHRHIDIARLVCRHLITGYGTLHRNASQAVRTGGRNIEGNLDNRLVIVYRHEIGIGRYKGCLPVLEDNLIGLQRKGLVVDSLKSLAELQAVLTLFLCPALLTPLLTQQSLLILLILGMDVPESHP